MNMSDEIQLLAKDFLSAWFSSEDSSSGYDSDSQSESTPLLEEKETKNSISGCNTYYSDSDTDGSDPETDNENVSDSFSFSDSDDSDDECESDDVIKYNSTDSLIGCLETILMLPHVCDTVFYVGNERQPMYGVKAIISMRSRVLHQMIIKETENKRDAHDKKKSNIFGKKRKCNSPSSERLHISIDRQNPDVFQSILTFIHTGSISISTMNVSELLCASVQYDVPELSELCRDFIERCTCSTSLNAILQSARSFREHKIAQKLIKKIYLRLDSIAIQQTQSPGRQETSV